MFDALLISLADGQSYKNVRVLEESDIQASDFPKLFEEYTSAFHTDDGRFVICHNWGIKLIHLDRHQRGARVGLKVERILVSGDALYAPAAILPGDAWYDNGVPYYFLNTSGITGQFVFSTIEGTFLTADKNVVSVIFPAMPKRAITSSENVQTSHVTIRKRSAIPNTVNGKIRHA